MRQITLAIRRLLAHVNVSYRIVTRIVWCCRKLIYKETNGTWWRKKNRTSGHHWLKMPNISPGSVGHVYGVVGSLITILLQIFLPSLKAREFWKSIGISRSQGQELCLTQWPTAPVFRGILYTKSQAGQSWYARLNEVSAVHTEQNDFTDRKCPHLCYATSRCLSPSSHAYFGHCSVMHNNIVGYST